MSYFIKETGEITLSQEEKKMFKECGINASLGRTPIADNIIKWILGEKKYEQNKRQNRRGEDIF